MTAEIRRYALVDANDREGSVEYNTLEEAQDAAKAFDGLPLAVVAHVYEYADTELIWTPDGDAVWPPSAREG